jgi:hypothetical protein
MQLIHFKQDAGKLHDPPRGWVLLHLFAHLSSMMSVALPTMQVNLHAQTIGFPYLSTSYTELSEPNV